MASTNKTTHYELSQYIGSDKPTYLGDYNGDMSKIDAQMYVNATNAQLGITNAGTAQDRADSAYSLASSANSTAETASTVATTANTTSTANSTNIGTMANLTTTDKTSLVNAINEVRNTSSNLVGDLTDLDTTAKSDVVGALNEVNTKALSPTITRVVEVANNISIAGNANTPETSFTLETIAGYMPVLATVQNTYNGVVNLWYLAISSGKLNWRAHNNSASTAQNITIRCTVLYVRIQP